MPNTTNRSSSEGVVYPCVRRLRHRRLLNFLRVEGLEAAFGSMAGETDACFSVSHLQRLVERGQWKDAVVYLSRFQPPDLDRLGLEAQVLHRFLVAHMALANIIAGTKEGEVLAAKYSVYRNHGSSVIHGIIRLRSIMLTALHAKQQLRTSMDWERVRRKASEIVNHLAYRTPELKGMLLMPTSGLFNNVLPISPYRRCHGKKQSRRLRVSNLAKSYLRKRSLLSSSHSQESHDEVLSKALNWVADIVDESLKAGKRPDLHKEHPLKSSIMKAGKCPELHQEHPLKPSARPGVTSPPAGPATFSTFSGPVRYHGMLYVDNAGTFASNVPTTGDPSLGTMFGVPSVFGCLTNPDKGTGTSLMTDAGTNKLWSQEGCNEESSQQGLNLQNDSRVLTTSDEQDRHLKKQRAARTI